MRISLLATASSLALLTAQGSALEIRTAPSEEVLAAFDIVDTRVVTDGSDVVFHVRVRGDAGEAKPDPKGELAGAKVYAYVWPTSIDSGDIGFEDGQGLVALAVTFHPDFDDAAFGGVNRHIWHPHWVVLVEDERCGAGLTVKDIPEGTAPKVPETWPGVPILLDSPEYPLDFQGEAVKVRIQLSEIGALATAKFDGVTAGLKVDANLHAPFLCVADVFKSASPDLSLPGKVVAAE